MAVAAAALRTHRPLAKAKAGTEHGLEFESGGHVWTYSIHLPADYDGERRFPVLVLPDHALVDGPAGIGFWEGRPGAEELILFRPEILKHREDPARFPDRQFFDLDQAIGAVMRDALRHLRLHYAADADRLFLTGLSQAGYYTWYFAVSFPDQFAGIVPESAGGVGLRAAVLPLAANLAGMPVRILHAEQDAVVPFADAVAMREALEGLGGAVELVAYTDADYPGGPYPNSHPGPHHLRLKHVLEFAGEHRRSMPARFTRSLRYRNQGFEGRFLVEPPESVGVPLRVTCSEEDGQLACEGSDAVYVVSPEDVLDEREFRVGRRVQRVKPDLELMLRSYKQHADPGRLAAAEIEVD